MLGVEKAEIQCPNCHVLIYIPFMRELKAQAIGEADLAEETAREKLRDLQLWLREASLFALLKFWWKRRRNEN